MKPCREEQMNCAKVDSLLEAYMEGLLSEREEKAFLIHLSACPKCQKSRRGWEALFSLAKGVTVPPVEREEWQKRWQTIRRELSLKQRSFPERRGWLPWGFSIAASVCVFFLLPLWSQKQGSLDQGGVRNDVRIVFSPRNESQVEYIEPGENYICSVEQPREADQMFVITVEEEDEP